MPKYQVIIDNFYINTEEKEDILNKYKEISGEYYNFFDKFCHHHKWDNYLSELSKLSGFFPKLIFKLIINHDFGYRFEMFYFHKGNCHKGEIFIYQQTFKKASKNPTIPI